VVGDGEGKVNSVNEESVIHDGTPACGPPQQHILTDFIGNVAGSENEAELAADERR
jgi:hypothetical protein